MNQIHTSRFFKRLRLRRRAVVRTIDFLVSFTLFIILLTQFYLIIINMNINLASTSTQTNNPAQLFTDKILSYTGTKDWGTTSGLPSRIGLASDYRHSTLGYYLDLSKLGHFNLELNNSFINSQFKYISPQYLLSNFSLSVPNYAFRISTEPPIQVKAQITSKVPAIISVNTSDWGNNPLSSIKVDGFLISLQNGRFVTNISSLTVNGNCILSSANSGINSSYDYLAIIYAHSGISWGITWLTIQNTGTTIHTSNIASFTMDNPILGSNSILQIANNTLRSVTDIIHVTNFNFNSTSDSLSNKTSTNSNTGSITQYYTNVGTSSPLIQVYSMIDSGIIYYRVVTLPLVFNNFNYSSLLNTDLGTSQYPVYQTANFSTVITSSLYTYSTMVMTDRGPLLFSVELSEI